MSNQVLRNITNGNKNQVAQRQDFPSMLKQFQGEIARALPRHINPDRMARIALTAFRQTPKLAECDPRSVFAAVIQSSQLGLEVGLAGEAHLVPFGNQCQLIPGYTGLMKLARQSGQVIDIYAHEVRIKDKFSLTLGLNRSLEHEPLTATGGFPASEDVRGEVIGFYAVAVLKDGSKTFVAMSVDEVNRIRDNSRGYQAAKRFRKESPWDTNFVAMGCKTVIRGLCKFLPKSPEMAMALALDTADANGKSQNLNLDQVIEGTFTPVDDDDSYASADQATDETAAPTGNGDGGAKGGTALKNSGKPAGNGKTNATPLETTLSELEHAESIEALDEVYVRAEGNFDGADLEILLRKYRECKEKIGKLI